jgi:hypothetical protein
MSYSCQKEIDALHEIKKVMHFTSYKNKQGGIEMEFTPEQADKLKELVNDAITCKQAEYKDVVAYEKSMKKYEDFRTNVLLNSS